VIESLNSKLFEWKEKIEFVNFRALKRVRKIGNMDIAFVEGAVSTEDEIIKLQEIRANANVLIALGSGAINGWPSNLRNEFRGEKRKKVLELVKRLDQIDNVIPVKKVVKVDDEIAGCPISEEDFVEKMEGFLNG